MRRTSKPSTGTDTNRIVSARTTAREKFKHFRDDDGEQSGTIDPENPPLTGEQLARMRPAAEVHPALVAASMRRRGGRPKSEVVKKAVSIRLDPDVIEALKVDGHGWQTRANAILRKALGLAA